MNIQNTTSAQDNEIRAAEASDHIQNLIAIIESLDLQLEEWQRAAGEWSCDTPEALREHIRDLPD